MAAALRGALVCTGDVELAARRSNASSQGHLGPRAERRERIAMNGNQVRILDGNTFVVSDERGDIEASLTDPTGLFSFDTRFLSKWILSVNGQRLTALSVDDLQYFETQFFLVPGTGTVYVDSKLSVIRHRTVGNGFQEQLTFLNHEHEPVDLVIRIEADCDFADLFEVKDAVPKKGTFAKRVEQAGAGAGLPARDVLASDGDLVLGVVRVRRERPDVRGSTRPARDVDDHPRRCGSISVATADDVARTRRAWRGSRDDRARTWRRIWRGGSSRHHGSSPTGSR